MYRCACEGIRSLIDALVGMLATNIVDNGSDII
jgi:hypothetical protein